MIDRLDKTKPISSELLPIMERATDITKKVNATARTIKSQDDKALNKYKSDVNQMIKSLQGVVTRCNLILQQTGNIATGPGTPKCTPTAASHTVCILFISCDRCRHRPSPWYSMRSSKRPSSECVRDEYACYDSLTFYLGRSNARKPRSSTRVIRQGFRATD